MTSIISHSVPLPAFLLHAVRRWRHLKNTYFWGSVYAPERAADYWSAYNITGHKMLTSREESLAMFHWRCDQYYPYLEQHGFPKIGDRFAGVDGCFQGGKSAAGE